MPQNGGVRDARFWTSLGHGQHVDIHGVAIAAFSVFRPPGGTEKRGYVHSSMGCHKGTGKPRAAILSGHSAVPVNSCVVMGTMLMAADTSTNTIDLFAILDELPPQAVAGAEIGLGSPGQTGTPVLNLGSVGTWQPFGTTGSYIALHDASFPPEYMPMLLGGQTYLNVRSVEYPTGAVRGQIEAPTLVGVNDPAPRQERHASFSSPNPFARSTAVEFTLAAPERVTLRIYDAAGRAVRTLVGGETMAAGPQRIRWDGRTDEGLEAAAGLYFYRLAIGSRVESRQMVIVR